jgi:LPS O-antigen subunit length determinant protein (WzzB/FepE family)
MSSDTPPSSSDPPSEPPGNGAPGYGQSPREDGVSVLDFLLVLARQKTLIVRTVLIFGLLGTAYAILTPEEYTSSAKVVREAQTDEGISLPGGISPGALSGLGISLGGGSGGLTPAAFPDVLQGREVQLAVVRDTFQFPDAERPMTFVEYVNRPPGVLGLTLKYTLKLPWTLKNAFGDLISDAPAPAGTTEAGEPVMLSEEEDEALETIQEMVATAIDDETGLMRISVTAGGPHLASDIAQSFIGHLTKRVREIQTKKVRERLNFVEERFQDVESELEKAEERLAQFLERNQNPTTATLQFRRDRLQRQVRFKEQLYSDLQGQLTQTRLDLQRRQPVVTIVEEPVPPTERSAPLRTLIVLVSLVVGGIVAIGMAFTRAYFEEQQDEETREKLREVRESLLPGNAFGRVGGYFRREGGAKEER